MKKLTKSATDRQVSGVLGGIAEYFGIDSTIVVCGKINVHTIAAQKYTTPQAA